VLECTQAPDDFALTPVPHRPAPENRFIDLPQSIFPPALCQAKSVCIIHTMNSRELIRLLEAAGWQLMRVRGSHHQFKHPAKPNLVTVPHPKKDLGIGLVKAIFKQAGIRQGGK
jgi:predicted RNA binding protein YcfA (HicA-like mRNA interferase family)